MALKKLSIPEKLKAYSGFSVVDTADLNTLVIAARWTANTMNLEDYYRTKGLKGETKETIRHAIKNVTSGLKRISAKFVGFDKEG